MTVWLNESSMVGKWDMAEHFKGFIVYEAMAFDPDHIPEGWEIKQIAGSHVHIGQA